MAEVDYSQKAITEEMGIMTFKLIYTGQADYVTAIASELGTNKQTVNNYLNGLQELKIIERKGTDDRRNRYTAHPDLLVHKRLKRAKSQLEQLRDSSETEEDMYADLISDFEEHEDKLKAFSEDYFIRILEDYTLQDLSGSSIQELLVQEFTFTAMDIYLRGYEDIDQQELYDLEWFDTLYRTLMVTNVQGTTRPIMRDLLKKELER